MRKLLFLFAALLFHGPLFAQNGKDVKKLQVDVQKVIRQVYRASVAITRYDAVKGNSWGGTFSGVVIDTAGYILSAAHAVNPGTLYEIIFPDGKKMLARGLGRIPGNDAAMLKINDKGKWPCARMGWSSSLQKGMPCISISYPNVVGAKTPTVRLGYIAETETKAGFIRSTCLMEPGDSGGPLFDLKGRVIGLHSRIEMSLDANLEVPVDLYRKYWDALIKPETYANLPAESPVRSDAIANELKVFPGIQELSSGLNITQNNKLSWA
jgi:serine protease Do